MAKFKVTTKIIQHFIHAVESEDAVGAELLIHQLPADSLRDNAVEVHGMRTCKTVEVTEEEAANEQP